MRYDGGEIILIISMTDVCIRISIISGVGVGVGARIIRVGSASALAALLRRLLLLVGSACIASLRLSRVATASTYA